MYPNIKEGLSRILGKEVDVIENKGSNWAILEDVSKIRDVAKWIKSVPGRCMTIAPLMRGEEKELVYSFDFYEGPIFNLKVKLKEDGIDSINDILKSAFFTEMELSETWEVPFKNLPEMRWGRWIVDDGIEKGILYAGLSETMSPETETKMWEKIRKNIKES
ncbi:MAG: NADH-quinone oxidoreductase subunit C [Thermoanaerobacteraceae bacterium]|nr:NADH-quinone oxidoreductase subunit C [Thermoanaerobacteraceae bacterium]